MIDKISAVKKLEAENQRLTRALHEAYEKLDIRSTEIENINSIVLRWDSDGNVVYLNKFGLSLFGYAEEEIFGQPVIGTIVADKGDSKESMASMIEHILTNPNEFEVNENENICKDGTRLWIAWRNKALFNDDGSLKEILTVGIDISDRKVLELELANKNSELVQLSNKLSKYLDPQVYRSIFTGTQDVELATKRKKLTVFFSDIKDFTATTESLQPEDLTYLLNDYFSEMSSIARDYGATIDKFIGDAILIFFGDPESHGVNEDAMRCVRMAQAMQEKMVELRDRWLRKGFDRGFHMRIGINTGYCNVGNFGGENRMDYTIIGSEVNLAARLEGTAPPDGIVISHATYLLVQPAVDVQKMEPVNAKGIERAVQAYQFNRFINKQGAESTVFSLKEPGIDFHLKPEELSSQSRTQLLTLLKSVVNRLEEQ